ncbi:MAG: DUF362 domain-containing protein [Anaerolineales bacterium]|nr:DUF362 domain-containing protein [Anaerolineales bacterium]
MNEISRRHFLRILAASLGSLGGVYLTGCLNQDKLLSKSLSPDKMSPTAFLTDPTSTISPPTETDQQTSVPEDTPAPSPTMAYPDLTVARNGDPEVMVRKAVKALGGMKRFVKSGDEVIVKPNICVGYHSYKYAATTNPWVVAAVVKLALEAGAKRVRVLDYPFGGLAEQAYAVSGIQAEVKKAGGKMVVMSSNLKYVDTVIPQGKDLKSCRIYDDVLKADVLINVPIAKHHGLARLTLGMKNMMGVIHDRPMMHTNLGQRLADLNSRVRSSLVIVDAVRMLMNNGPSGGNLADVKKADTIIASPYIVSADSYAATLFGLQPNDLAYIKKGAKMGLGVKNLDQLKIEEINLG